MRLRQLAGDRRGAVSIIAATCMFVMIGLGAVSVDVGSMYLSARRLQGVADLAAIAAARDIAHAEQAARATVAANAGAGVHDVQVVLGRYTPTPGVSPEQRFVAGAPQPNAARVHLNARTPVIFATLLTGESSVPVVRKATATRAEMAAFSVGSRVAAVRGGLPNALLGALLGSSVNLTVADYESLVDADVDLFRMLDALAVRLNADALSYDSVLDADVSSRLALLSLADALTAQAAAGQRVPSLAAPALRRLAALADDRNRLPLHRLLDLGPYGAQDHKISMGGAQVAVSALDLTSALLMLAQGGRHVQVDLGAAAPGLASVVAHLAIGDRPAGKAWLAVGEAGQVTVHTSQLRLYLDTQLLPGALSAFGVATVRLPLLVEAASAQAQLASTNCASRGMSVAVRPGLATAAIGSTQVATLINFQQPVVLSRAALLSTPVVTATGYAKVELAEPAFQTLNFTASEIAAGTVKQVSTHTLAGSLATSLATNADLRVNVFGLGVGLGGLSQTLGGVLGAVAPALDLLIGDITDLLGVSVGEADVVAHGLRCGQAALVG